MILLLTVGFAVYYLVSNFSNLWQVIKQKPLFPGWLLLSFVCILSAVFIGVFTWKSILRGFGYDFPWHKVLRMHMLPTLAKYIPGLVWQFSGKAYLAHEMGMPLVVTAVSIGIEVGLSLLSGIALFFLFFANGRVALPAWVHLPSTVFLLLGVVLLVILSLSPVVIRMIYDRGKSSPQIKPIVGYWYLALVFIMLGWGLISMAFYTSANAFGLSGLTYLDSMIAISGAYVGGILAIFVPNGLVVREAVLLALLPPAVDQASGLLLSLLARVEVIICELLVGALLRTGSLYKDRVTRQVDEK